VKYTVNEIVAAAWYGEYTIGQLLTRAKHSTIHKVVIMQVPVRIPCLVPPERPGRGGPCKLLKLR
jgi:hypothetical protein